MRLNNTPPTTGLIILDKNRPAARKLLFITTNYARGEDNILEIGVRGVHIVFEHHTFSSAPLLVDIPVQLYFIANIRRRQQ